MRPPTSPVLDPRKATGIFREFQERLPAYVPAWSPVEGGSSWALLQMTARLMQVVIERLNQAPDKNMLAFLDMLGLSLIPPQAARAPVVFDVIPNAGDGRAPAGTRLGAAASRPEEGTISFETESAIALAEARLVEVVSLWPARDGYADHGDDLANGRAFTLFEPLQPVPHILYLAHDTLLALTGQSQIQVEVELSTASGLTALDISWEFWDGQVWRPFATTGNWDGTDGMSRSGMVHLSTCCGQAEKTDVNGIEAHWLRGRLNQALPPRPGIALPMVERIWLSSIIERPLVSDASGMPCTGELMPDHAFGGGSRLDLTRTFQPFGASPNRDTAFYFTSQEIFSKPGAEVTVCFRRELTPDEEADEKGWQYEAVVNFARRRLVDAALKAAEAVHQIGTEVNLIPAIDISTSAIWNLARALEDFPDDDSIDTLSDQIQHLLELVENVVTAIQNAALPEHPPGFSGTSEEYRNIIIDHLNTAKPAANDLQSILETLRQLGPTEAAAAGGVEPPELQPPRLVWEYWDGNQWVILIGPDSDRMFNFLPPDEFPPEDEDTVGEVEFTVPEDMRSKKINGVEGLWVRVRLQSGSYNRLRIISWTDPEAGWSEHDSETGDELERKGWINFIPIVEPRPPALDAFYMGYTYRSARTVPQHCLTYNDFTYTDRSIEARWSGSPFPPFHPMEGITPTLYLGFDQPLPKDWVSLYLEATASQNPSTGPPLRWEAWDGQAWREVSANDETAHLAKPGMLAFIPPEMALLARFGADQFWVRARLKEDGPPPVQKVNGLHLNAVWAIQQQTLADEILGGSSGQPGQVFFFRQLPVLADEQIEVRELSGSRAAIELPLLTEALELQNQGETDIRTVTDSRTGRVTEVWVRWQARPHFYFSGPDDRHYVIERARGRIIFGDNRNGKIPPPGANNILARRYQSGGGRAGNVPAGAITQLLSLAPPAQAVSNVRAGEGGAEGESIREVKQRGPGSIRHRWRAVTASDYEALAREASPGVAVAPHIADNPQQRPPGPGLGHGHYHSPEHRCPTAAVA